jgi:hypothetical protein
VRYDTSRETFTGMTGSLGSLPAEVKKGIREVDYNVIAVKDPAKPNPSPYPENDMDKNSYFGDPQLKRAKPAWDIQYADYSLAVESPAFKLGFKTIPTDNIGLRKDFPFDKALATRRVATEKIQAEDYQRRHELRTRGGEGIYEIRKGSWAKYANLDFGAGSATKALFRLDAPAAGNASNPARIIELRLDAPDGQLIGTLTAGQTSCPVQKVAGVRTLFLVFSDNAVRLLDWFQFQ